MGYLVPTLCVGMPGRALRAQCPTLSHIGHFDHFVVGLRPMGSSLENSNEQRVMSNELSRSDALRRNAR